MRYGEWFIEFDMDEESPGVQIVCYNEEYGNMKYSLKGEVNSTTKLNVATLGNFYIEEKIPVERGDYLYKISNNVGISIDSILSFIHKVDIDLLLEAKYWEGYDKGVNDTKGSNQPLKTKGTVKLYTKQELRILGFNHSTIVGGNKIRKLNDKYFITEDIINNFICND